MKNILRVTRYFPLLSAVIVLLAITFDVGYFAAIDLSFFTFFSLPEHLLFAMEALPLAFAVVTMIALSIFLVQLLIFLSAATHSGKYYASYSAPDWICAASSSSALCVLASSNFFWRAICNYSRFRGHSHMGLRHQDSITVRRMGSVSRDCFAAGRVDFVFAGLWNGR